MRYRIGAEPGSGAQATDDMMVITLIISFVVGIVLNEQSAGANQIVVAVWPGQRVRIRHLGCARVRDLSLLSQEGQLRTEQM